MVGLPLAGGDLGVQTHTGAGAQSRNPNFAEDSMSKTTPSKRNRFDTAVYNKPWIAQPGVRRAFDMKCSEIPRAWKILDQRGGNPKISSNFRFSHAQEITFLKCISDR
jgi:hypothetical protein